MATTRTVPTVLRVVSSKREVDGVYYLVKGEVCQGLPVWDQASEARQRIYSDPDGRWLIGTKDVMGENAGWVMSVEHGRKLPHEPEVQPWLSFGNSEWAANEEVHVDATGVATLPCSLNGELGPFSFENGQCQQQSSCQFMGVIRCRQCGKTTCPSCKAQHDLHCLPRLPQQKTPPLPRTPPLIPHIKTRAPQHPVSPSSAASDNETSGLTFRASFVDTVAQNIRPSKERSAEHLVLTQPLEDEIKLRSMISALQHKLSDSRDRIIDLAKDVDKGQVEIQVLKSQLRSSDSILAAVKEELSTVKEERNTVSTRLCNSDFHANAAAIVLRAGSRQGHHAGTQTDPSSGCPGCGKTASTGCCDWCPARWFSPRESPFVEKAIARFSSWRGCVFHSVAGTTLSDGCTTVTKAAGGPAVSVLGTAAIVNSGMHEVAFTITAAMGSGKRLCVGVSGAVGAPRVDLRADGSVFLNGECIGSHIGFSACDVVVVTVDLNENKVCFAVGGNVRWWPLPSNLGQPLHPCVRLVTEGDTVRIDTVAKDAFDRLLMQKVIAEKDVAVRNLEMDVSKLRRQIAVANATFTAAAARVPNTDKVVQAGSGNTLRYDVSIQASSEGAGPHDTQFAKRTSGPANDITSEWTRDKGLVSAGLDTSTSPDFSDGVAVLHAGETAFHNDADSKVQDVVRQSKRETADFSGGPTGPRTRSRGISCNVDTFEAEGTPATAPWTDSGRIPAHSQRDGRVSVIGAERNFYAHDSFSQADTAHSRLVPKMNSVVQFADPPPKKVSVRVGTDFHKETHTGSQTVLHGVAIMEVSTCAQILASMDANDWEAAVEAFPTGSDKLAAVGKQLLIRLESKVTGRLSSGRSDAENRHNRELEAAMEATVQILDAVDKGEPLPFGTDAHPMLLDPVSRLYDKLHGSSLLVDIEAGLAALLSAMHRLSGEEAVLELQRHFFPASEVPPVLVELLVELLEPQARCSPDVLVLRRKTALFVSSYQKRILLWRYYLLWALRSRSTSKAQNHSRDQYLNGRFVSAPIPGLNANATLISNEVRQLVERCLMPTSRKLSPKRVMTIRPQAFCSLNQSMMLPSSEVATPQVQRRTQPHTHSLT
ncbi:hypothetical protein DIPPA_62403 [Diplonema papillatum]|nr:hypothetical protein DIPPA_62403 [Diplonema papillatum]